VTAQRVSALSKRDIIAVQDRGGLGDYRPVHTLKGVQHEHPADLYQPKRLAEEINAKLLAEKLSTPALAVLLRVSLKLTNRARKGEKVDVETYLRIKQWLHRPDDGLTIPKAPHGLS